MVLTSAGIDPVCTEQVNKIYVYFFKPRSSSVRGAGGGGGARLWSAPRDGPPVFRQLHFWSLLRPGEGKQLMHFNEVLRKERQLTPKRCGTEKLLKGSFRVFSTFQLILFLLDYLKLCINSK